MVSAESSEGLPDMGCAIRQKESLGTVEPRHPLALRIRGSTANLASLLNFFMDFLRLFGALYLAALGFILGTEGKNGNHGPDGYGEIAP
jgi:hypothetical protein